MTTEQATNRDKLEQLARFVLRERNSHQTVKDTVNQCREKWESDHKVLLEAYTQVTEHLARAEAELRIEALGVYAETGDKHPGPGVDVRVGKVVEYDKADAFKWAKEHLMALALDASAFKALVKADAVPKDVATIREEPTVTIATDLETALKKEEE